MYKSDISKLECQGTLCPFIQQTHDGFVFWGEKVQNQINHANTIRCGLTHFGLITSTR